MHKPSTMIRYIQNYGYSFFVLATSFVSGWVVYVFNIALFPDEGALSLLFHAVMGAIAAGILIGLVDHIVSLVRVYVVKKYELKYYNDIRIIVTVIALLIYGLMYGTGNSYFHLGFGATLSGLSAYIALIGIFIALFFVRDWPANQKR